MMPIDSVRRVTVVGAGAIGASWAAYFLSRGMILSVYDPEPAREHHVSGYIKECWPTLRGLGMVVNSEPESWTFHTSLQDAVRESQYIQESAPDEFGIKRALFAELDQVAPAETIVASSTSSLILSDLQRDLATRQRFVVAHPFNPPHVIPVVEVVGGQDTSRTTIDWCCAFLERHGKAVVRLKREVVGHIINRLQAALLQEAICLVRDGVAEVGDIDRGMAFGPAVRWALMGPFLTFHLGAREGGIRNYLRNLGPAHERIWDDLGKVGKLGAELIERIAGGVDAETGGTPLTQLLGRRDVQMTDLVRHLACGQRRLLADQR